MLSTGPQRARWLLFGITLALVGWADIPVAADSQKRVLALYTTRRDEQLSIVGERLLPQLIDRGLDQSLDYYSEFIDVGRFSEPSYANAFRDFLLLKYQAQRFDLVVGVGDVAVEFLVTHRHDLFPDTPIVFFANQPHAFPNSTGIIGELKLAATLAMAADLQPDLKNVFVVTGASSRDKVWLARVRTQFQPLESRFNITYLSGLTTKDLHARLASLPDRSIVYYTLVYQDGAGANFAPIEYLDHLQSVARVPTYGWSDSAMDHGTVGGSLFSQQSVMEALAARALRVLRGEPASSIPVSAPDLNVKQVDWRQLRRWGIPEARIPAGTLVRFRAPDGWDRYRNYIFGAVVVVFAQSLLIAGLLVQKEKRRRAENNVRESEAALRRSHERIHDLGGRLLVAQEAERARIARELHDDINQQVALLAIDLELLREGRQRPDAATLVEEACERAHGVAKSLHDLSHQLHPARLRMLGLVPALTGLQRELTRPDCVIEFSSEDVPGTLPHDITLCLFRVAQEALHNALTHSSAGRISVHLAGEPGRLVMTIVDDGVGFDVDDAWRKGLGLISIGERLESVAGALDIQSQAGAGTRISIRVPLPEASPPETVSV